MTERASRRVSGRQITVMVVAICLAIAAPTSVLAATGAFKSSSAGTAGVTGVNTAAGDGAIGVDGEATGSSGRTYGVYGRAKSSHGYGVYSAGTLGTSKRLVCNRCVTPGDAATLFDQALAVKKAHTWDFSSNSQDNWLSTIKTIGGITLDANCVGDQEGVNPTAIDGGAYLEFDFTGDGDFTASASMQDNVQTAPVESLDQLSVSAPNGTTPQVANFDLQSDGSANGNGTGFALWFPKTGPPVRFSWDVSVGTNGCAERVMIDSPMG